MTENALDRITKRPWGNYEILKEEKGVWVKRIEINPAAKLSLQKHFHREERWVIASGVGLVSVGEKGISVQEGSMIEIPVETLHRISNTGTLPLVFIEVAYGETLSEEDIVRIEDDYGRS